MSEEIALAAAGYEQAEIGARLGMTRGAINSLMVRARSVLTARGQDRPRCTECDRPRHARGLCLRHYNAQRYQRQRWQAAVGGAP